LDLAIVQNPLFYRVSVPAVLLPGLAAMHEVDWRSGL